MMVEYATELAEKAMVDKYNLLPEQMSNKQGEYLEKFQTEFNGLFDKYIANMTKLSQNAVQNEIDEMYDEFVKENDREPEYAVCIVGYKDTPEEVLHVTFKLSLDVDKATDESIFYYCNSPSDLKSFAEPGGEDFVIMSCKEFN